MTPDMTVVSKHGGVSLVTSGIDVALASGRGGLPINRVVAAFFVPVVAVIYSANTSLPLRS